MGKLLLKFGTGSLTDTNGFLSEEAFTKIARQVSSLMAEGWEVCIVSSGAVQAGIGEMKKSYRDPAELDDPTLASIGAPVLMSLWQRSFHKFGKLSGQILFTHADLGSIGGRKKLLRSINRLTNHGFVPTLNENDPVSFFGIKKMRQGAGDNDYACMKVNELWEADLVQFVTELGGVFDLDPRDHPSARLFRELDCTNLPAAVLDSKGKSKYGRGGIGNKTLQAAKCVDRENKIIISGFTNNAIYRFAHGEEIGTLLGTRNRF